MTSRVWGIIVGVISVIVLLLVVVYGLYAAGTLLFGH